MLRPPSRPLGLLSPRVAPRDPSPPRGDAEKGYLFPRSRDRYNVQRDIGPEIRRDRIRNARRATSNRRRRERRANDVRRSARRKRRPPSPNFGRLISRRPLRPFRCVSYCRRAAIAEMRSDQRLSRASRLLMRSDLASSNFVARRGDAEPPPTTISTRHRERFSIRPTSHETKKEAI